MTDESTPSDDGTTRDQPNRASDRADGGSGEAATDGASEETAADGGFDVSRRDLMKSGAALGMLGATGIAADSAAAAFGDSEVVGVGSGSYARRKPMPDSSTFTEDGQENKYVLPSPVQDGMYLTSNADPTPQSNSWWSNNWFTDPAQPHGGPNPTVPLPWYTQTTTDGLTAKYSDAWLADPGQTQADRNFVKLDHRYTPHVKLGHSSGGFADSRVDDWGDFHTRISWGAGTGSRMDVTLVKGSPLIFAEYTGGDAEITLADLNGGAAETSNVSVWADRGNVLGVSITGIDSNKNYTRHFGIFAPSDATWSGVGTGTLTSSLGSGDYLAVAPLHSQSTADLDLLEDYAYNIPRDTKVTYEYVPTDDSGNVVSEVRTTYEFVTEDKPESAANGSLAGLMPHQWKYSDASLTGMEYWSPRGTLKVHAGTTFQTTKTYPGVLPHMPDEGTYDRATLQSYVDDEEAAELWSEGVGSECSTYWIGKDFDHHLRTIPIAEQVGDTAARDRSLDALKTRLEGWMTVQDTSYGTTEEEEAFAYYEEFGSLTGYPAEFYSSDFVNDHHFHYGYYVKAAAELARHDGQFLDDYGDMIDLLVREYANWERPTSDTISVTTPRDSPKDAFPHLRNFDPYEGHSWAAGFCLGDGNDQESSSEAMMANSSIIMWAEHRMATADSSAERDAFQAMRDMGIALYTEEMHAIWEYWFDNDDDSHPDNWASNLSESETSGATGAPEGLSYDAYDYASIVWGDGYVRNTFWGQTTMEEIWGINWLPIDGHSFYLNLDESYAAENWSRMVEARGGDSGFLDGWHTAAIGYRALSDPADAVSIANSELPIGRKSSHIYHWAHNLNAMGTPNQNVVADVPQAQVFEDGSGNRTYVAYNADGSAKTVTFSDGYSMSVPANSLKTSNGDVTEGLRGSSGDGDTTAPSAPTNLSSPGHTTSSVDLGWDASSDTGGSGLDHYTVYQDGAAVTTVAAGTTSTTISGLSSNTTFDFSVSAVDGAGNESAAAGPVTVTTDSSTDSTAPGVPSNLSSTGHTTSSVDLSWDGVSDTGGSGLDHYAVYVDGSQDQTVAAGTTSATVPGLASDTAYDFSVTAIDGAGNESGSSNTITVTTNADSTGGSTTYSGTSGDGWSATVTHDSDTQSTWEFTPNANAGWADVQFVDPGGSGWIGYRMDDSDGDNTHVHARDTSSDGDQIDFRFVYGDGSGGQYISDRYTHTYGSGGGDTTAPSAPTNLTSPSHATSSVDLDWDASSDTGGSGLDHYNVFVDGSKDQEVAAGTTSATVGSLSESTTYDFTVTAVDGAGNESSASGTATVTTDSSADTTAPTVPSNLASPAHDSSSVDLSWDASSDSGSGVDHYNVYVDGATSPTVQTASTSATVSSLSASTTYDFAVSAVDAQDNESAKTSPISVTTDSSSSGGDTVSGENWTATLTNVSSSELEFVFDHSPDSDWVDVHLTVNGGTQLNYRMTEGSSSHSHTEGGLSAGDTVEYYFTYEDGGLAYDTSTFNYTF